RQTADSKNPHFIQFSTTIDGRKFNLSTRLVVVPHFSYHTNYLPQFRLSEAGWQQLGQNFPQCVQFLQSDSRIKHVPAARGSYAAYQIQTDTSGVLNQLHQQFASAMPALNAGYYNPHRIMAGVLEDLYKAGALNYVAKSGSKPGYLSRTAGACQFC